MIIHDSAPEKIVAGHLSSVYEGYSPRMNREVFRCADEISSVLRLSKINWGGSLPTEIFRYRSSKLEVMQSNLSGTWSLYWDEKFFEYVEYFLCDSLIFDDLETTQRSTLFKMLCIHAECHAVSDPEFALIGLLFGRENVKPKDVTGRISVETRILLNIIYALLRASVYLHEQAHFDIEEGGFSRDWANRQVESVVKDARNGKLAHYTGFGDFDGFVNPSEIIGYIAKLTPDDPDWLETMIDCLAFDRLVRSSFVDDLVEFWSGYTEDVWACIYPGVMIWHYVCATVNEIRHHFRRRNAERWAEYLEHVGKGPGRGHARNNVRGFLLIRAIAEALDARNLSVVQFYNFSKDHSAPILESVLDAQTECFVRMFLIDWKELSSMTISDEIKWSDILEEIRGSLIY